MAGLVEIEPTPPPHWIVKAGVTTLVLIAVLVWVNIACGPLPRIQALTTDEDTTNTLDNYVREPPTDIVLVGSSLMYRLKDGYFRNSSIRNIAIAGDSPETGLRIIESQTALPKLVIVETNILERRPNLGLVRDYAPTLINTLRLLARVWPVRSLVAIEYGFTPVGWRRIFSSRVEDVLNSHPAPNSPPPYSIVDDWSRIRDVDQIKRTSNALVSTANRLRAKGVRVVFVNLPMLDQIEASPLAAYERDTFKAIAGSVNAPQPLSMPRDQLRWSDGQHLDERSSILVARAIEESLFPN
ncbi:hypothetical protein ACVWZL_003321 [Bradyrhizobium sp. GM2.4]